MVRPRGSTHHPGHVVRKFLFRLPELSKKWTEIGLYLFSESKGTIIRKAKAIRERWLSHLNPAIKKYNLIKCR